MQVHGLPGLAGDVRQHPRAGEQTAPVVPPAPPRHAGRRGRGEGLDR